MDLAWKVRNVKLFYAAYSNATIKGEVVRTYATKSDGGLELHAFLTLTLDGVE
jgi:hypothetical protein